MSNQIYSIPSYCSKVVSPEIITDKDILLTYLKDESSFLGFADGLIRPSSEEELCNIVKWANKNNIKLTISAKRSSLTGSSVPTGGIVVSTEKLNQIIKIDKENKLAISEPGIILGEFQKKVEEEGLFYPPDPTSRNEATLGGTVACNSSGARTYKYGSTRNYIRRIKVILANGEILNIRRGEVFSNDNGIIEIVLQNREIIKIKRPSYKMPNVKNAAGYYSSEPLDLIDLFIGSEGTLGIISEIEVSLLEPVPKSFAILSFWDEEEKGLNFVLNIREIDKTSNIINLECIEWFDENSLKILRTLYPNHWFPKNAKCALYLENEYNNEEDYYQYIDTLGKLIQQSKAIFNNEKDIWIADTKKRKEELKEIRHSIPTFINEKALKNPFSKISSDLAVPDDKLVNMMKIYNFYLKEANDLNIEYIIYGHIGNNHLHLSLIPKDEAQFEKAKEITYKFAEAAVRLGGTVSAEHGIGKIKHTYLKLLYGEKGICEMVEIKKSLDPNLILGIGNIFPEVFLPI